MRWRTALRLWLGLALGVAAVLLINPSTRRQVISQAGKLSSKLKLSTLDYRQRLTQAVLAFQEAAKEKEKELETKMLTQPSEEQEETPDYIV